MIIVAGSLTVAPEHRQTFLDSCRSVIEQARVAAGCSEFYVSADPLDTTKINVFERWDSVESVEMFRGSGVGDEQQALIIAADVAQYEIADVTSLT